MGDCFECGQRLGTENALEKMKLITADTNAYVVELERAIAKHCAVLRDSVVSDRARFTIHKVLQEKVNRSIAELEGVAE